MYQVTVQLRYPWPARLPEEKQVSFVLSGEYPCNSEDHAREVVLQLIVATDPGWVMDRNGVPWPFYRETVRGVSVKRK